MAATFLLFRNKRDTFIAMRKSLRKLGNRQLDTLTARASATGSGIDILDDDNTDSLGTDFLVVSNAPVDRFRLRFWDSKRKTLSSQQSYTDQAALVIALNSILQTTDDDADLLDILLLDGTDTLGTNANDGLILDGADSFQNDAEGGVVLENNTQDHIANPILKSLNLIENSNDFNVIRNENTNSVEFKGANKPFHFLGTLTAVAGNSSTTLSIRNDGRTLDNNNPVFEFFDLSFTQFRNASGTLFADRDTAITQLNILFGEGTISSHVNTSNFFHYDDNSALTGREFNSAKGPAFWGQSLNPGEELVFANSTSGILLIGKFGGATSVVGQTAAATANWDRRIGLDGGQDVSADGTSRFSSTGMQIGREMDGDGNNTFAMRYDRTTNKLQLIDMSHNHEMLIGEATTAENGSPITIFFQAMSDADTFTGNVTLPAITQREVDLILHAEHTVGDVLGDDYTNGVVEDAVFSMNKPLNKGEKLKFTPQTNHGAQAILFDYTGSSGSGTGQTGVESRTNAGLIFAAHDDGNAGNVSSSTAFTINQYSSRYDTSTRTLNQIGREMSIRYHTDNKVDLYDETAEEILFTKDSNADGNPITLFLAGMVDDSGSDKVLHLKGLNMDVVGTDMGARCASDSFELGTSQNVGINTNQKQIKNRLFSNTDSTSGGFDINNDQQDRIQFGAKLRPGMESSFTGQVTFLSTSATRARGNQLGVMSGTNLNSGFATRYAFNVTGELITTELINAQRVPGDFIDLDRTDTGGSDAGDEVLLDGTDGSSSDSGSKVLIEQNTSDLGDDLREVDMRLRYEHSTNLLHLDAIQNGVRKRVATGVNDLGGDEVTIFNGGQSSKILALATPKFYGMEYAHTLTAHPQLYRNMNNPFLDWPSQNTALKADTVIRHIDGIMPGFKIHWQLPTESGNSLDFFFGDWKTGNASSGLSGLSADPDKWNWGFQFDDANEKILTSGLKNMEFNKKHPFYDGGAPDAVSDDGEYWQRPDNENKKTNVSWRYHDNNTVDLYDEDIGVVIMNYIGTLDGSAFKFAWVSEHNLSNSFHPGYITDADPTVSKITEADGDLPNGEVSQILRGKTPLLGANYYVAYGPNAGTRTFTPLSDRTQHPTYFSNSLDYRKEFTFNFPAAGQTNNSNYALQIWKGDVKKPTGTSSMDIANVEVAFGIHNNGLELDTTHGTDLSADVALTDGEQLVLRFDHDGYVRLLRPSTGYGILATSNRSFKGEACLYIHLSGDANAADGQTTAPTLVERGDFWKIVAYDTSNADAGYDTDDWRVGTIASHVFYQTVRPLSLGQKYTGIILPEEGANHLYGIGYGGYTGSASITASSANFRNNIGQSGDGTSFDWHTGEKFNTTTNVVLNTSNSNYDSSAAKWDPGTVAGGTKIEFRYITSSKKVEVWDADNNEKILTSTNVMDASGRDINLVIGSFQNDLDTPTITEYNIENIS